MANGWGSSRRDSFKRPRSPAALRSGSPKRPIPSVARGPRTTQSFTRRRSAPDSCRFRPAAERPSPSPSLTARPMATPTCGHKRSPLDEAVEECCSPSGGRTEGTRCSLWTQASGNWCCPRRRLRPRFSTLLRIRGLTGAQADCCLSTTPLASGLRRSIPGARLVQVPTRRCWTTCTPTSQLRVGVGWRPRTTGRQSTRSAIRPKHRWCGSTGREDRTGA